MGPGSRRINREDFTVHRIDKNYEPTMKAKQATDSERFCSPAYFPINGSAALNRIHDTNVHVLISSAVIEGVCSG